MMHFMLEVRLNYNVRGNAVHHEVLRVRESANIFVQKDFPFKFPYNAITFKTLERQIPKASRT